MVKRKKPETYKGKKVGWFLTLRKEKYKITAFTKMSFSALFREVETEWKYVRKKALPKDLQPKYIVPGDETLSGEPATFLYDELTLYKPLTEEQKTQKIELAQREYLPDVPEKDIAAWERYLQVQNEFDNAFYTRLMDEVVNCVVVPMDKLKAHAKLKSVQGALMPDPAEDESMEYLVRRSYVMDNVIFNDQNEWARLLKEALVVAGAVDEQKAENAFQSFRNQAKETEQTEQSKPERASDTKLGNGQVENK